MTITVQELVNRVSDDIARTISATSTDPSLARVLRYYNRIVDTVGQICVLHKSDLARTTQVITTVSGTADYPDFKDILDATEKWGYITLTSSKSTIRLISEQDSTGYGFTSGAYAQPTAFYVNGKNYVIFCPTPDDAYSISIPFWKKFPIVSALTYDVASASKANPCVVGSTSHPFKTDDRVYIDSVLGMTELNGYFYDTTWVSSSTFSLQDTDSTAYTTWSSAGTIYPCVPFNGIFDNIIAEMVTILLQNRDEYDQTFESGIIAQLQSLVMPLIDRRKKKFSFKAKGYNG